MAPWSTAFHDVSSSPRRWRLRASCEDDGNSCAVLSHARRVPLNRYDRYIFQARATAMQLTKLPTTMRGSDIRPCSHPYSAEVKYTRCAARNARKKALM